jgi:hypothetical protein
MKDYLFCSCNWCLALACPCGMKEGSSVRMICGDTEGRTMKGTRTERMEYAAVECMSIAT